MALFNLVVVTCAAFAVFPSTVAGVWYNWFWSNEVTLVKKCFNEYGLGCYTNESPFNNSDDLLPQSPREQKIEFYLYTRQNKHQKQILNTSVDSIRASYFNVSKGTKFIIHGYMNSGEADWISDMKTAFLDNEDINIIAVNWKEGANEGLNYYQSVANTRVVGDLIGHLINEMVICCRLNPSDVHLIGHSLGAHAAGYAGTYVSYARSDKVGRITGLDPAGPGFDGFTASVHLDPSDAYYVEVVHTDGDYLWTTLSFGTPTQFGHVDFYPNGGGKQPGCPDFWEHLYNLIIEQEHCDHSRAYQLYIDSIELGYQFKAYPCANKEDYLSGLCTSCGSECAYMGFRAPSLQPNGTFFFETPAESPYNVEYIV